MCKNAFHEKDAQESSSVGLMSCVKMCRVGGPSNMVSGGRDGQPPSAPQ